MNPDRLPRKLMLPLVVGLTLLTGACGVPLAVSAGSYAADGGLMVASDKTSADHITSVVTKQDCAMWRILRGQAICRPRVDGKDPYNTDYSEPQRQVSEDGTQFAPPLRAPADAPTASWDAATYKTLQPEVPPPVDGEPLTATNVPAATGRGADVPVAKAPSPGSPRKARTLARSAAKKPARGLAATAR